MTVAREPKPVGPAKPAAHERGQRPAVPAEQGPAKLGPTGRPAPAALDRRGVQSLQGAAGNAAVSRLMVQRLRAGPGADPKFAALRRKFQSPRSSGLS